ncbi:hypothetical protein CHL78_006115 [Romboutsia weinsteinii]|uniref:Uncharacterized protein n=1 Tax=Romboutsia weinsteinii TaxID=2020949 RepID=A0A371J609_9FIRM|nr:hypothetical protein [Romboutsia weinsteinii]RDY28164.1 hypothetical protein CHL78_006115 [Romboutsia weinsteinii]
MKTCSSCGIGVLIEGNKVKCFKYNTEKDKETSSDACLYYIDFIYEDGELLNQLQHLLLKEQDLKSKHMKNTI